MRQKSDWSCIVKMPDNKHIVRFFIELIKRRVYVHHNEVIIAQKRINMYIEYSLLWAGSW